MRLCSYRVVVHYSGDRLDACAGTQLHRSTVKIHCPGDGLTSGRRHRRRPDVSPSPGQGLSGIVEAGASSGVIAPPGSSLLTLREDSYI